MRKRFQLFTTDSDFNSSWFPIDHFFYAPVLRRVRGKPVTEEKVVHLETHAAPFKKGGMGVSVIHGAHAFVDDGMSHEQHDPIPTCKVCGKSPLHCQAQYEEYNDIPSALRRMADIIEAHAKSLKPVRRWVPKVGDHVKVTEGAGCDSGKTGIIIPRSKIPLREDGSGIPKITGHYDVMKKDEYGIREDGTDRLFTMFRNYLQKVRLNADHQTDPR